MSAAEQVLDEAQLGGLAEAAGIEGVKVIIDAFWSTTTDLTNELSDALSRDDFEQIKQIGHAIKGSSANVGAALMADRGLDLENAAKASDKDAIRAAIITFSEDVVQTRTAFEDMIARYS